jgi:hypothetical protein
MSKTWDNMKKAEKELEKANEIEKMEKFCAQASFPCANGKREASIKNLIKSIEYGITDSTNEGLFYYICFTTDNESCSRVSKYFKDKGYEVEISESKNYVDTYSGKKTFKIVISW